MTKKLIALLIITAVFCSMSSALAASAGSADDPLISKSYIDSTYPALVLQDPLDTLTGSMTVLKYKLSQVSAAAGSGAHLLNAMPGGKLTLVSGSGLVFISGSCRVSALSGTLIDLSDGTLVSLGQALTAGHRYVAAENTQSAIDVVTASRLSTLGSTVYGGASAPAFTDVLTNDWFYSDVCYAVTKGLVNGRSTTVFAPNENLSLAEAIKLAACMNQLYNTGSVTLKNDATLWYKNYVAYALQSGIIAAEYANYNTPITRSEFVKVFYAALPSSEYGQVNTVAENAIPDIKTSTENATQIYTFYRAGILTGSDMKGTFNPNSNIKRSEVATILTRMFETDARKTVTLS